MKQYIECKRLDRKVKISDEAIPYTKENIQSLCNLSIKNRRQFKICLDDLGWLCECGNWTLFDKKFHNIRFSGKKHP